MSASCIGWSVVPRAIPSIVSTVVPSSLFAGKTQLFFATPSTTIVQAPQEASSQPRFVPVRPSVSRRTSIAFSHPSSSTLRAAPLTVKDILSAMASFPSPRWPS